MKITRKQIKFGLIGILFVGLVGAGTLIYLFNLPHRDVLSEEAVYKVSASQLVEEFLSDQPTANKKYLDQVVAVTGMIVRMDKDMNDQVVFLLMDQDQQAGVRSTFTAESNPDVTLHAVGEQVEIKGIVRAGAAYLDDLDLVEHVILEKSVIVR